MSNPPYTIESQINFQSQLIGLLLNNLSCKTNPVVCVLLSVSVSSARLIYDY